jgi:thymidylate synthase
MYQRSADVFIGLPVNIASYALLTNMLATSHGFGLGTLTISLGDAHIYKNHVEQCKEQLTRSPFAFPKLIVNRKESVTDYVHEDFTLEGYQSHPAISV